MCLVLRGKKKRSPKHHFHPCQLSRKSQLLEDCACSVGTLKPASTFDDSLAEILSPAKSTHKQYFWYKTPLEFTGN